MSSASLGRFAASALFVFAVLAGTSDRAHAQGAWAGLEKSLTVDLGYQYVPSNATVINPDDQVEDRPTKNHLWTLSSSYVPFENFVVEAALPVSRVRYYGRADHYPAGKWDDGNYHTTLTDLRLGVRYQLLSDEKWVAFSPHLAVSIPVMDYEVNGFATGGRGLKTVHVGASIGRTLDPILPNLYFTGSYEFSMSERYDENEMTEDIPQRRSDVNFEAGYLFLDGALSINGAINWRTSHGGVYFEDFAAYGPDIVNFHDPILAEKFLFAGGGISYSIKDTYTISVLARFFVQGYNTRDQNLIGVNLTWTPEPFGSDD